ncbi:MAG: O-antigen ligase family protein [Verrucomicrobia bacterium]|nr:O-antigen ligase family protein [Verrucomicrobiota bacterium]
MRVVFEQARFFWRKAGFLAARVQTMKGSSRLSHQIPRCRWLAQLLFFATGVMAVLLFGGVEGWAKGILACLLSLACLFAAAERSDHASRISRHLFAPLGLLLGWVGLSLCPWPSSWAQWIAPGQHRLLAELDAYAPATLRIAMAPAAAWGALFTLIGAGMVVYLSWWWSAERSFRIRLNGFIPILGSLVAALGLADRLSGSDMLYGFRHTEHLQHWGAFINRNHFSNVLNISALFALGIFLRRAFPRKHRHRSPSRAFLALSGAFFCGSMSLATASRGGLISLLFGLFAFGVMFLARKRSGARAPIILSSLIFVFGFFLTCGRPVLKRMEAESVASSNEESEGRWQVWRDAWLMSLDMRGRGIGVGAFETVFPAFQTSQGENTVIHAENEYLEAWVEWGVVGAAGWLALAALLVHRMVRTRGESLSEWQIAGWSALVTMLVHAAVDFPFHVPANAWLTAALLGMLVRGHDDGSGSEADMSEVPIRDNRRWGLLLAGMVLLIGACFALAPGANSISRIERGLKNGNARAAWNDSRTSLKLWPFYWRAHELAGYAAAGADAPVHEVERFLHSAQKLASRNAWISFHAGLLFLHSKPEVARDFFDASFSIAERPALFFDRLMGIVMRDKSDFLKVSPLGLRSPERWCLTWEHLRMLKDPELTEDWLRHGAMRWLENPVRREKILRPLVMDGWAEEVLDALDRNPPVTDVECYWQSRAWQEVGAHEAAARSFRAIWNKHKLSPPVFDMAMDVTEFVLRQAALDPSNLVLQRKIAGTLSCMAQHAEAIPIWERVLRLVPNDFSAQFALAVASEKTGDWSKAAQYWGQIVAGHTGLRIDF